MNNELIRLIFISISFAFMNRARGSRWFDLMASTSLSRILATMMMGGCAEIIVIDRPYHAAVFFWTWASLYFWCVFSWDKYWSAAIGNPTDLNVPAFAPVDWIMRHVSSLAGPPLSNMELRIWGLDAMTLRQSLAAVCLVGLAFITGHHERAFVSFGIITLGLPYFIAGLLSKKRPITYAEYGVGTVIGALIFLILR